MQRVKGSVTFDHVEITDLVDVARSIKDHGGQDIVVDAPGKWVDDVEQSAESVANTYRRNIFPAMKMTWGVHPNNLGHNDFPGCFRCHDRSHASGDGQTISNDGSAWNNLLVVEEQNPKILAVLGLK